MVSHGQPWSALASAGSFVTGIDTDHPARTLPATLPSPGNGRGELPVVQGAAFAADLDLDARRAAAATTFATEDHRLSSKTMTLVLKVDWDGISSL